MFAGSLRSKVLRLGEVSLSPRLSSIGYFKVSEAVLRFEVSWPWAAAVKKPAIAAAHNAVARSIIISWLKVFSTEVS